MKELDKGNLFLELFLGSGERMKEGLAHKIL